MNRYFAGIILACLSLAPTAYALDIHGLETLLTNRNDGNDLKARIAQTTLQAYFAGQSDLLSMQAASGQTIYFGNEKIACLPSQATLSGGMLLAMVENELRKPVDLAKLLGADWKDYVVSSVLMAALARNYPCR